MNRGENKARKPYEKPSYQAEEILEKMSLVCKEYSIGGPCKTTATGGCAGGWLDKLT